MTVKDLIKNKDYDYISWRITVPDDFCGPDDMFIGCAKSENGKLISLDGDTIYDESDEVIRYEEWSNPEKDIINGLTVVIEGIWE